MVNARLSALKSTSPSEYLVRFAFGGAATVLAGVIAKQFGATLGGLFLAFPAICPAALTLIEAHERQRKHSQGQHGTQRGRMAASLDARGAELGTLGLMAFALAMWKLLPGHNAALSLFVALAAWTLVACGLWWASRSRYFRLHARRHAPRRGATASR